jgi:hypothetical protein
MAVSLACVGDVRDDKLVPMTAEFSRFIPTGERERASWCASRDHSAKAIGKDGGA